MKLVRSLLRLRSLLLIPLALGALASTPADAQPLIIQQAPPAMRYEPMPGARPGYAWDRGNWRWRGNGYVWVPGHWQPVMHRGHWMPGHWQAHGPHWYWVEGRWVR
ncbi:YXWGXW repeat-containing protein [Pseudomonas sp. Au-Pse12]|uniref:YXWGXW repeat-containing protein n=1 Tax=Pseudomonas sp. Au-Pse12 TaxID=2906459 RepID=UPI001E3EB0FB|nr:YXWGXW repeat-containing protein [Pseudomonas sp. Au-Pse12]MCE4056402.1 YXWGXW repeat-containing protein [Pseudomonas sp. Au-Pse12]